VSQLGREWFVVIDEKEENCRASVQDKAYISTDWIGTRHLFRFPSLSETAEVRLCHVLKMLAKRSPTPGDTEDFVGWSIVGAPSRAPDCLRFQKTGDPTYVGADVQSLIQFSEVNKTKVYFIRDSLAKEVVRISGALRADNPDRYSYTAVSSTVCRSSSPAIPDCLFTDRFVSYRPEMKRRRPPKPIAHASRIQNELYIIPRQLWWDVVKKIGPSDQRGYRLSLKGNGSAVQVFEGALFLHQLFLPGQNRQQRIKKAWLDRLKYSLRRSPSRAKLEKARVDTINRLKDRIKYLTARTKRLKEQSKKQQLAKNRKEAKALREIITAIKK
jgi:hypothetical protein